MDRRTVLASTGIAFSAALAGCSELEDDTAAEDDDALEDQKGDHDQDNGADNFSEDEGFGGDNSTDDTDQGHDQEEEQEDAEDDEPEERPDVILPEEAEDHLDVLSHDLDSDGTGCDFYAELERTSSEDEYHVSFDTEVTLYSDNGETIAKKSGPNVSRDDLGEGESRVYSVSFDDCQGANQYTFEVVNFSAILAADAMEADVDIHPELEDKIEVGHEFSWVDEPRSGQCRISISVRNTTQDYVISATANSDNLNRGFTNLEPGRSDNKEIEGSCTEDIERYLVRIGTEDYEIEENELVNDHNEEIDIEGEVILGERAEEHLNVLDHALVWRNAEEEHCEVRVELEKTSPEKYIIDDGGRTNVYDDDGESITGALGPSIDSENLKEGESRVFSTPMDGGYEGLEEAAEYEVSFNHLNVSVPVDELEPDFNLDSELEGKLKVIDSSISFEGGDTDYAPVYDSQYSDKYATVENVTENYRLTVTGPSGEYSEKTVDLKPGETAGFALTGWEYAVSVDDLTYGFSIEAEEVEEIDNS